ncbi:hypothetical protein [uncultured Phascolarctobacterium sp.]|uniref:hypothetical protein n=1 Tax=uncultured Phascolarctobacterium sp. TaxID=512296 RepID=UPI0025F4E4FC|nr:hypothetical protein [uncultured Phascolarctobacterium sp.]
MRAVLFPLPLRIKGFIKADADGFETIVLNSNLTNEANRETFIHELTHSRHGDLFKVCCVDEIENLRHK